MKKLFAVLVAILLLAVMACSSKSDDSSSSGNSNSNSNTTSAIVNSTGGTVQLADGANATIPAGAVADNTKVTLTKLAQPQVSASQATAVTDTYQIDIPAGSITSQSGSDIFVTFQIPVPTSISTVVKAAISKIKALATSSNSDDAYYVSEVTISNDTSTSTLYGRYTVSNGVATVSVVNAALASSVSTTSKLANKSIASTATSIKATITTMSSYFSSSSIEAGLYNVNSSSSYQPVNSAQNTGGKIPIILVHGLQINDSNDYHPEKDTWKYFIDYFNSDENKDLQDKFPLYTYRYDTTKSIDSNGKDFAKMVTNYFPSQNVIIIAHSMGGLVAHSYIQEHSGGSKVNKLITLATPYHGSQLVQGAGAIALVSFPDILLVMGTSGSLDLAWDNYPNATKDDNMNASLFELNNDLNKSQYASLYNAFAGSKLDSSHGVLINTSYDFLNVLGYESDGVVPLVSAFNNGHPQGFVPQDTPDGEKNYDHSQMTGKKPTDQLFDKIKAILPIYNISGTVTLNGTGLVGVTVTLTGIGTSSTVTTDANGVYTFSNAANGSYTLSFSGSGYTFSPSSVSVKVNGANFTVATNIVAATTTVTYSMSGTIHVGSDSGAVLSGATVSIAGLTATTDGTGYFYIAGIPTGTYAFSIAKSGYDTYTNPAYYVGSDQTVLNFYLTQSSTSNDYTSPNIGTLKYVPAGSFQRDSDPANISTVSAFRMSQYEITRAQFLAIMGTDPSYTQFSTGTSDPVQMVNWYHAIAFCNKMSIAEGLTPVYSVTGVNFTTLTYADIPTTNNTTWDAATANWSANGYRLPTEMEWMWAAMGATSGSGYTGGVYTTGYLKAFAGSTGSNAIGDYAWTVENSEVNRTSQPVGTKLANELGLYDMSGNVWEWCWDWYDLYPTGTQMNYRGAASGAWRVVRGGAWDRTAPDAAVDIRVEYPGFQDFTFGFRVVRPYSGTGTGGLVPGGWREVSP